MISYNIKLVSCFECSLCIFVFIMHFFLVSILWFYPMEHFIKAVKKQNIFTLKRKLIWQHNVKDVLHSLVRWIKLCYIATPEKLHQTVVSSKCHIIVITFFLVTFLQCIQVEEFLKNSKVFFLCGKNWIIYTCTI